jgi:hypothetical protein
MHSQRSALVCTRQSTLSSLISSQDSLEGTTHLALPCTLLVHGKHTVYIISRSADMQCDATDRTRDGGTGQDTAGLARTA